MPDKMTVLFVKHTGHVLAAVTRNADPTGKISVEDVARGGLLVRSFKVDPATHTTSKEQFNVPPSQLDVLTTDLDPALLLQPRTFIIDDGRPVQPPNTPVPTVSLMSTTVRIELDANVTEETKVWVQVSGGNLAEPRTADGKLLSGTKKIDLQIQTLDLGTYNVLTLVGDRLPHATSADLESELD